MVAPPLAALPGLQLYDQTAIRLVPWAIVVFGAAVAILARLLPGVVGRWILIGDLLAGLLALAMPVGAWLVGRGEYSELERTLRVSWPGGLLVLLLVAKAAVCGAALWRVRRGGDGPAGWRWRCWRSAWRWRGRWHRGAWRRWGSRDEPGYLAAALGWRATAHLGLSNNGYAPWMLARVQYPEDAWGHEFPDNGLDRLVGGTGQPAARRHARCRWSRGRGWRGRSASSDTASTATEIVVRVDGATGEGERITLGPAASRLIAIPAGADWRGATVEASQPVGVAVRLTTATGALDGYGGAAPSAQFCVVVPSLAAGSEARLFLRNDESGPVGLTVRRYDSDGRETAAESPTMLANGTLVLPLPGQEAAQTVFVAERPVAAVGLARLGEAGLLALPALATVVGPLAIPAAPTTTHETGGVFLIVHNPGEGPVRVRRAGDAAPLLTLAPRATGQVRLAAALAAAEGPVATLEADGPVVAAFLQAFERHRAVVAPLERGGRSGSRRSWGRSGGSSPRGWWWGILARTRCR
ncbi:MAG: hypothetical protein U0841_12425 [Chloroflexia bacterium]